MLRHTLGKWLQLANYLFSAAQFAKIVISS